MADQAAKPAKKGKAKAQNPYGNRIAEPGKPVLPAARVAKILKADPDITKCSKEAVFAVSLATEFFIRKMMDTAYTNTRVAGRKTVTYKDLAVACVPGQEFYFLEEVVPRTWTPDQALEKRKERLQHANNLYIDPDTAKFAAKSSSVLMSHIELEEDADANRVDENHPDYKRVALASPAPAAPTNGNSAAPTSVAPSASPSPGPQAAASQSSMQVDP